MDIRQVFSIVKRWLWFLLLGAIIGGAGGYFFSSRQAPVYEASTRFIVVRAVPTSYYELDYYLYDSKSLLTTYTELLSSESLLEQASTILGFPVNAGQASAAQVGETQFIQMLVKDKDAQKAAAIANVLVKVLIDQNEQLQSVRYILAEENLQQRVDQAEEQMVITQDQINNISRASVAESLTQVEGQINSLQSQITTIVAEMARINPEFATEADNLLLSQYQADLDQLRPVLDQYQQIYTNLVVLKQPVEGESGTGGNSQLEQLQTTFNLYRDIYVSGIASLEDLRLARVQNTPNVIQTEIAKVPEKPISPKPIQTAILAALTGLLIAGAIAFLVEYLDDTLKTPEDVEQALNLPVIGFVAELPSLSSKKSNGSNQNTLFVANQPRSMVSEALRSLRTNLEFAAIDHPLHTLLITSASPSEGKSTVAANLALIIAQGGKRTLLLDTDMRRPSTHRHFDISNRVGLSDLLRGRLSLDQVVVNLPAVPNLSVIPSGSLPPNPAELLSSERFSQVMEELQTHYDFIILDSSPMVVADPQILASRVDGVVFIIQPGKTRIQTLNAPMRQLTRTSARLLGVVFNRIPQSRNAYYGGYQYYSPYNRSAYTHDYYEDTDGVK